MAGAPGPTADYDARRDFRRTPEPAPAPAGGGEAEILAADGTFVIHRHEARRLHYDLRMATDRVLVCWAVPRGFSYDPAVKHLAVHTEDHPLRYRTFEGVIPKGEYGAGTMLIWDTGSYEVLKADNLAAAIAAGEVKVVLRGRRLRGEWHLVRTRAGHNGNDEWLLFKARDRYAREDGEPAPPVVDPRHARPAPLPARPGAMAAAGDHARFSDPDWLFELEFDGRRILASVNGGDVALLSRSGAAARLPASVRAAVECDLARVRASQALIDGVLVALDRNGRPAREALEYGAVPGDSARRATANGDAPLPGAATGAGSAAPAPGAPVGTVAYYAFDLLHYDGWDLRGLPLVERKQFLRSLLPPLPALLYADHVTASGESLAAVAADAGFHGLVAKRAASSYRSGVRPDWRRVPLQASAGAREVEVHAALSAAASRQRKQADVRFSNLDKVYWPDEGYTKGDLLAFYEQVADYLLPYLRDRPVHMNRYPDGVGGKSFFQRQAPAGIPDWVELVEVDARHTRQFICNDLRTLLYLVNLGSIELHPWLSRRGSLAVPDFAVLDLDAKEAGFRHRGAGGAHRRQGAARHRPAARHQDLRRVRTACFRPAGRRLQLRPGAAVHGSGSAGGGARTARHRQRGAPAERARAARCTSTTCRTAGAPPWCRRTWRARCPGHGCRCRWSGTSWTAACIRAEFTIANVPEILARRGDLFQRHPYRPAGLCAGHRQAADLSLHPGLLTRVRPSR